MEPEIKDRYNDQILQTAMQRFGIAEGQIKLLDGFESFMYEFQRDGGEYILRIGHSRRRTVDLIKGEVDWINALAAGGAGVAKAIRSASGALVEVIDDSKDGQFLVTAFTKALGRPVWEWEAGWTPALYERYGELLGRIHALSRRYTPADPAWKRLEWDAPSNLEVERWLSPDQHIVHQKFHQVKAAIDALPRGPESYGLVHQDAHPGNFFVTEEGQFTLFDFDDCVYSWYIYDVAMVVFYMIVLKDDPLALTREFMPAFWRGYRREFALDPRWLAEIPLFMKLREIDLYAVIHRSYPDVNAIEDRWPRTYMQGRKARIENDVPLVEYDFRQAAEG
ncbi:MAG: phosphotransferase [Chloroflexi bacterium]|nr:phosphotransferase [Chloroflexota bacterium]